MRFQRFIQRVFHTRLLLVLALLGALTWIALTFFRRPGSVANPGARTANLSSTPAVPGNEPRKMEGDAARNFLQNTSQGQSLMKAVEVQQYGLKHEAHSPFDKGGGAGYLGMSHDENLNVWFGEEGAAIRPTLSQKDQDKTWRLEMKLKAYGYSDRLTGAPPVVAKNINENRIEYERADSQLPIADSLYGPTGGAGPFFEIQTAIGDRQSTMTEWYVNKSEGIEQGFTLNHRPERRADAGPDEALRLVVSVTGDLQAHAADDGQSIILRRGGDGVLSYGHLVASDANGRKLTARMETNAAGDEISLVVDDAAAQYPITIDPITASLESKIDAEIPFHFGQVDARFGFSVAVEGNTAVVGSWREDSSSGADTGAYYIFVRNNSSWSYYVRYNGGLTPGASCGWSVAISNNRVVVGCPGANNSAGEAIVRDLNSGANVNLPSSSQAGDRFGNSVAIVNNIVVVGAPLVDVSSLQNDAGEVDFYALNNDLTLSNLSTLFDPFPAANDQFGTSVSLNGVNLVVGEPNVFSGEGRAVVFERNLSNNTWTYRQHLKAQTDSGADENAAGDNFGNSVAMGNDSLVVGSPLDDNEKGVDAGSAYVFLRDSSGLFRIQQKLVASNGRPNDHFSEHAVAIESNTVVVGAQLHDSDSQGTPFDLNEDRGAVYIFTRSGSTWTQQTEIQLGVLAGGEAAAQFGIGVDLSSDTVIIGARAATAGSVSRAGAAWVYRLDCLPPEGRVIVSGGEPGSSVSIAFACPGNPITFTADYADVGPKGAPTSYQWRKNGVNIAGANSQTYVINSVSAANTGNYDVLMSNSCGSNFSRAAVLNVFTFTLSATSQNFLAAGGNGSVTVNCGALCGWTATPNASWITITSGSSGLCGNSVNFTVASNTGPQRTGTLTIAGQLFTVTQDSGCSYSITPLSQNFPASNAAGAVNVTAGSGCAWTSSSNAPFLTITSGSSGNGNGSVGYSVTANPTTSQRTGTLTIAGQTFTVTQEGAAPTPTPTPSPSPSPSPNPSPSPSPSLTPTVVQFSSSNYDVQEDCTALTITVNRIGDTSGAASVDYNTTDGSASERRDYIKALGTLRFAAGETSKSFAILINEDSFVEGNETFNVNLINPSGASLGGPAIASVTITDDTSEPATNAIDDPRNYVCQHYHDFLNRQPDTSGWDFWTNQITSCGNDAGCVEVRRINVSASFFLSIEFQDTGYLVERIYKTAYGDATGNSTFPSTHQLPVPVVRLNEFLSDTQEIGLGVVVGQGNWQQQLEANKQGFTAAFVQRSRFLAAFPLSMTALQFVDTLNANAGNPLSTSERNQLVNDLSGGVRTRAQVLRAVAEDADLNTAESNRAFVLMQYFGYLRRNPNDPQDTDHTGYDFWLTKLNQFNGNYISAEMVKAFITSIEYRQRFGQ